MDKKLRATLEMELEMALNALKIPSGDYANIKCRMVKRGFSFSLEALQKLPLYSSYYSMQVTEENSREMANERGLHHSLNEETDTTETLCL